MVDSHFQHNTKLKKQHSSTKHALDENSTIIIAFPCYNQSFNTWVFTNTLTNQNNQQLHIKVLD
jgi:hypothetical protein